VATYLTHIYGAEIDILAGVRCPLGLGVQRDVLLF
jgi:hypothetical protein